MYIFQDKTIFIILTVIRVRSRLVNINQIVAIIANCHLWYKKIYKIIITFLCYEKYEKYGYFRQIITIDY